MRRNYPSSDTTVNIAANGGVVELPQVSDLGSGIDPGLQDRIAAWAGVLEREDVDEPDDESSIEPISPELALIDPELRRRARMLLPDAGEQGRRPAPAREAVENSQLSEEGLASPSALGVAEQLDESSIELISPELALIDPELARRARTLLPDVGGLARPPSPALEAVEDSQLREESQAGPPALVDGATRKARPARGFLAALVAALFGAVCLLAVGGAAAPAQLARSSVAPTTDLGGSFFPGSLPGISRALAPATPQGTRQSGERAPLRVDKERARAAKRMSSTRAHVARVHEIDGLATPKFASVRWARAAFGRPTTRQRTQDYCRVSWRAPGLTIILNRIGDRNPCEAGQPVGAVVKGTQWRTSKGLRIGQPLRLLRTKYPHAGARPDGWWLLVVKPTSVFGRTRPQPTLMAHIRHGRIRAFVVG